ncbi:MAG: hypothetical protein CMM04_05165 [Rhodopirellula sp.]|jgi:hypothetical protein|nr:hypothetical protein [Rhodopirellula sp.]MCH2362499.1 DUF1501 domain-containing protein [Pirellulales bacterium]HCP83700.1 DUF1501 domain-containing protein [Planctomycetaceae bacterium]|tara:strand:+ start:1158 stop:2546 length:1389 start_codon:yes stop_codon:yes gene_type:complete
MTCSEGKMAHQFSRRNALQIGAGMFGLNLPQLLEAETASGAKSEMSCIFLFLAGGPSHYETFDPKPDAPAEIRGLWDPISTNVPGVQICEKMPLMSSRMDKVAVVRSWRGRSGSHSTGSQHVTSGMFPAATGQYYPNFGCLLSTILGPRAKGMPSFFGLPTAARYTTPTGYLGAAHASFNIEGDPVNPKVRVGKLQLEKVRFENRQSMLAQLDNLGRLAEVEDDTILSQDKFATEAVDLLTSGRMQKAMNLDEEPLGLRERYGMNIYGQRVLLGRRLIQAGARFVTINHAVQGGLFGDGTTNGTWDNHGWLFDSMMSFANRPSAIPKDSKWHEYKGPGNLPQFDMSLSTLLDDLEMHGMLDTTLVVAMGEFGRTPKINKTAGRDHYPSAGCAVLAGGGVKKGVVIGATDSKGTEPSTRPWYPEDFAATIYKAMGVDPHATYLPRLARPTPISPGHIIDGLLS